MGDITYKRWKKLGEFLILKYMDGVVKDEYFKPVNVGYPNEFKKIMVQLDGPKIAMKRIPIEIENEYKTNLAEAEKNLKEKNYKEAKNLYQKALDTKPDNEEIKQKIEKLDNIIKQIEEIHKSSF